MKFLGKEWTRLDTLTYLVTFVIGYAIVLFGDMRFPGVE